MLAGAIAHLAESQLRRSEMGRAGREGVEGRSWATVMDELLDHYHRALGRTARGREAA
jgi:phosphatidylinositol alpha 1,6-mannosyltransferase